MSDSLIDIVGVLPAQIAFAFALSKMLAIRNLPAYWVSYLGFVLIVTGLRSHLAFEFRLIASVLMVLILLAMSKGGLARRLLIIVLAYLVLFFVELPGSGLWMAMTGSPISDYDAVRHHLGAFFFTHAIHLALLAVLLAVLCSIVDRFDGEGQGSGRAVRLPALFTLLQLVLVGVMLFLPFGSIDESMPYYVLGALLSLLGLVADLLLIAAMGRYAQKRFADGRAAMLGEQLDRYLANCEELVYDIENVAKMRHDVGNHLQVILAMSECGRFSEARKHLELVQSAFAAARPTERRAS